MEAALNDFLVFEESHSEFTLLEALRNQLEDYLTTEVLIDLIVHGQKCQLKYAHSNVSRKIVESIIRDLHMNIFIPSAVFTSLSLSLKCTIHLYRFPGMRLESYSYTNSDGNSLLITLGCCNGHYVSLKKLEDTAATADVHEVQVLHHFQDQAATDRQAQTVGHPGQTWIHYKDMSQVFSLAPAEGNIPRSMFNDPLIEARTFPDIYPTGVGGYDSQEKRERKLSRRRFCNQRYLNVDQRCVQSEYILMTQYMTDAEHIEASKSIAMRMTRGNTHDDQKITASFCRDSSNVANLVQNDRAYRILKDLRDSPPFLQTKQYEAYAMVRQIGLPTFFISLSAADLYWPDFLMAVAHQQGKYYTKEKVESLTWQERADLIRSNPVTAVRMFKYRLDNIFTEFLESSANPIGKVSDKMKKIEFQGRGSPHNHSLVWIEGAPQFIEGDEENNKKVCESIDKYICARIPEGDDERSRKLRELVLKLQIHKHSAYCRRDGRCRFGIPAAPSPVALISGKPVENSSKKVKEATSLLQEVMKVVICFPDIPLEHALTMAKVEYDAYLDALAVSCNAHHIVLRREPNDCFVNPYNPDILLNWEANMDIQYVLDAYSCIMYLVSYVLKDERALSDLLRRASKENQNESIRKQMDIIGNKFLGTREMPIQKAIMMELSIPIFEKSRQCVFVSGEPRESRVRLLKNKDELENMDDDDENIFHNSIHDKYAARPNELESECLVSFAANYSYSSKIIDEEEADNPDVFPPPENDTIKPGPKRAPRLKLKDSMGSIIPRTKPAIVRLHRYSIHKERERYFHAQLMLFLPWRNEDDLIEGYPSYEEHYAQVQDSVIANAEPFNRNLEEIEAAQIAFEENGPPESAWDLVAPSLQDEIGQAVSEGIRNERTVEDEDIQAHEALTSGRDRPADNIVVKYTKESRRGIMETSEYEKLVHNLNAGQFKYIKHLRHHIKSNIVRMNNHQRPIPLRDFLTGPAGTGKSYVIRLAHRDMMHFASLARLDKVGYPVVLLTAPSGVAAFNIGGMTTHSALCISQYQLGPEKAALLTNHLGNLMYMIVDEVSFMGPRLHNQCHNRLTLVKGTVPEVSFGGVGMMENGDLYQLPPVKDVYIFKAKKNPSEPGDFVRPLWQEFRMHELTEIMRQEENDYATVLNNIRTCGKDGIKEGSAEDKMLLSRELHIGEDDPSYPGDILHAYARRKHADEYNSRKLAQLNGTCLISKAVIKTNTKCVINFTGSDPIDTGNLPVSLEWKIGARVMMPVNVDVSDGLFNGAMGTVVDVEMGSDAQAKVIFVEFDNANSGTMARQAKPAHPKHKNAVPLTKVEVTFFKDGNKDVECHIIQFPLILCYALTIHKTQGITVDGIVVNMAERFNYGQAYVAFSRVRKLSRLHIINYDRRKIKSSPEVDEEMERLRKNMIQDLPEPIISRGNMLLSIGHLNIQGLMHHQEYLKDDPIMQCDVLCLSETWLCGSVLDEKLPFNGGDTIQRKDRKEKGGGVLIRASAKTNPIRVQLAAGPIEVTAVRISYPENVVIICCYRPEKTMDKDTFLTYLGPILANFEDQSVIVLGDFNEDLYVHQMDEGEGNIEMPERQGKCEKICTAMIALGYRQIIQEPTYDTGSLLDHIYVRNISMDQTDVQDIYFSDHDARYCFRMAKD